MKPLLFALLLPLSALAQLDTPSETQSIPFAQLGAEADKKSGGAASSITPTATGAHLKALMQDLEAEATPEGLWLTSTADEDAGRPNRFGVRAMSIGREGRAAGHTAAVVFGVSGSGSPTLISAGMPAAKGSTQSSERNGRPQTSRLRTGDGADPMVLPSTGIVRATQSAAVWVRPGLIEEYTVSTDGVRQDFVVLQRPAGAGDELAVDLEVSGARTETADYGVKLTVSGTGRELAYSRLKVTDATGRELTARLDVVNAGRLRVIVQDAGAAYPVRIDPTFSDADWVALNPSISGANDAVRAMVVDGSGTLYVGGLFTAIGSVEANYVAKWDGSAWSTLGSGMNSTVWALAVNGSGELYAGGQFTTAGGTTVNRIAKWNGSAWSPLGTGMNSTVLALAVSGGDLYAGGSFTTAGGTSANYLAKWDGSAWSTLGSGMNDSVFALAVSGGDLYAGGRFTTADGTGASRIAKWDGSTWSALGSGSLIGVGTLAVSGPDLYAGGWFTTAGGTSARYIAKWDGSTWSALGSGINSYVDALAADASGHLFVGGSFVTAGTTFTPYIAQANLNSLSAIESWRQAYFGTSSNSGNAADLFDFEKDGLVNLLEYAFGLNPTLSTPSIPGLSQEGGYLTMTITKQPGVAYEVQTAGTLATGEPDSFSAASTTVLTDNATTLNVRDNVPIGSAARRFIRVEVTAAP